MPSRKCGMAPSRSLSGQKKTYRPAVSVSDVVSDLPPSRAAVPTGLHSSTQLGGGPLDLSAFLSASTDGLALPLSLKALTTCSASRPLLVNSTRLLPAFSPVIRQS